MLILYLYVVKYLKIKSILAYVFRFLEANFCPGINATNASREWPGDWWMAWCLYYCRWPPGKIATTTSVRSKRPVRLFLALYSFWLCPGFSRLLLVAYLLTGLRAYLVGNLIACLVGPSCPQIASRNRHASDYSQIRRPKFSFNFFSSLLRTNQKVWRTACSHHDLWEIIVCFSLIYEALQEERSKVHCF